MRRLVVAVGAIAVLAAVSGCASKSKQQLATLRAENVDLRQRTTDLEGQYAKAQSEADAAQARVQNKERELAQMRSLTDQNAQTAAANAQAAAAANQRLAAVEMELAQARTRLDDAQSKLVAASRPEQPAYKIASPQLEAFRRDLEGQMSRFHVSGVDVDLRTAQDGQQRVALVLQNSFRPGSASLTQNVGATKAVVGLGKLVSESYPGSRVVVEGHTDSDPINKSRAKWDSNESLSLARAEEVKKVLRQAGVQDRLVSAVGMGSRQPVARGATDRAKAQNRRVEIYIYPTTN
jgi:flagellar motor protein MotB